MWGSNHTQPQATKLRQKGKKGKKKKNKERRKPPFLMMWKPHSLTHNTPDWMAMSTKKSSSIHHGIQL